jgi:phage repressor protein C with HTH and peptisase S24 domain
VMDDASGPRRTPARGFGVVRVRGRSMEPTLRDGALLLVRWGAPAPAPIGRVVVVRLPDRPLSVKRLVSLQDGGWWVERDNPAEGADSWLVGAIPPPDQAGVVVARLTPFPRRIAKRSQ